jgi:AP-1 complex subunit mu
MSYRLSTAVRPLIWIEAVVEPYSHSRIEYLIKAKSQFKLRRCFEFDCCALWLSNSIFSTANNVEIRIPVPSDADTPKFKANLGRYSCLFSHSPYHVLTNVGQRQVCTGARLHCMEVRHRVQS